jgi:hypothetical protein
MLNVNLVPILGKEKTWISPPSYSIIDLQRVSPRPTPHWLIPSFMSTLSNILKSFTWLFLSIPIPESSMINLIDCSFSDWVEMSPYLHSIFTKPSLVYFIALLIRFWRTYLILLWSEKIMSGTSLSRSSLKSSFFICA